MWRVERTLVHANVVWESEGIPVEVPARSVIFSEGDEPGWLYRVLSGKVRVGRRAPNGQLCLFHVHGPMDVFGEDGVLDAGPRSMTATAMTDVRALRLDRRVLAGRLSSDPEMAEYFLRVMARRMRRTSDDIADLMSATVSARVAKHLLQLAQRFGVQTDGAIRVELDLTQELFAQLVGTSRESMNKALNAFVDRGWIQLRGDAVLIVDSRPLASAMNGVRRLGPAVR